MKKNKLKNILYSTLALSTLTFTFNQYVNMENIVKADTLKDEISKSEAINGKNELTFSINSTSSSSVAPRQMILLLDTSSSMLNPFEKGKVSDRTKAIATTLINSMKDNDKAMIIFASYNVDIAGARTNLTGDKNELLAALDEYNISNNKTDPSHHGMPDSNIINKIGVKTVPSEDIIAKQEGYDKNNAYMLWLTDDWTDDPVDRVDPTFFPWMKSNTRKQLAIVNSFTKEHSKQSLAAKAFNEVGANLLTNPSDSDVLNELTKISTVEVKDNARIKIEGPNVNFKDINIINAKGESVKKIDNGNNSINTDISDLSKGDYKLVYNYNTNTEDKERNIHTEIFINNNSVNKNDIPIPVNKIIKAEAPKETHETIKPKTIYKEDKTKEVGYEHMEQGRDGDKKTVITYKVNEKGQQIPSEPKVTITNAKDTIITKGTKPKATKTNIDYSIKYEADDKLEVGQELIKSEGLKGFTETTINYKLDEKTGQIIEDKPIIKNESPKTKVIIKGTKPLIESSNIDFNVVYKADDKLEVGKESIKVEGKKGLITKTTTYTLDEKTGQVKPNEPTEVKTDAINKVILKGTKPKIESKDIPYKTLFKADDKLEYTKSKLLVKGETGKLETTTTYSLNEKTGEVVTNEPTTKTFEAKDEVIIKGVKPLIVNKDIDFNIIERKNSELEKGKKVTVIEGEKGLSQTTTIYVLDEKTGEVSVQEPATKIIKNKKDKIVEIGTKEKTVLPKTGEKTNVFLSIYGIILISLSYLATLPKKIKK